jgi:phosphoglycerate dehydrogenase-like enzyme
VFEIEPVPDNAPLIQHENFHGTPHIGAATLEAQHRVGIDIAQEVITALKGQKPTTLVNSKFL